MMPTVLPAQRRTASSIWNSFRSSGKKHLLVTGSRGSGKTTLLSQLLSEPIPGIRTWAVPEKGVFMESNGASAQIGFFVPGSEGKSHRMSPVIAGFLDFGIPAIKRCIESPSEFVSIDEIGYLEAACPEYCAALEQLFEKKRVIAAVRKQELPFLCALKQRSDAFVLDLDAPFGNGGCVIMASGLGSRFGGNKLMADFRGEPLIAGALAATEAIPHRVVVTRHENVAAYCKERKIDVILHALPHRSDTIRLGLEAMEGTDYCIFCQGDQPLLKPDTVAAMAMLGAQANAPILRAGSPEASGAPTLFHQRFYDELRTLPQGKGGNFVAKNHPEQIRFVPVSDARELLDVDTPEDLDRLKL